MSREMSATLPLMKDATDEEIGAILAENLKRARARSGLKAREVAAELNTNEMQLSRWENGKTSPHAVTLARLANLYKVPIDILYVKDHPMLPPPPAADGAPSSKPTPAPPKSRHSNRPPRH